MAYLDDDDDPVGIMRNLEGCQFATFICSLAFLVPIFVLWPFTDDLAIGFAAVGLSSFLLAYAAFLYRRKTEDFTLQQSTATWVMVVAPTGGALFLLLFIGRMSE